MELSSLTAAPLATVVVTFLIVVVVVIGGAVTGVVGTAATCSTYAVLFRFRSSTGDNPGFTGSGTSSFTTGGTTVTSSVDFSTTGAPLASSVTTTDGFWVLTTTGALPPSTTMDTSLFSMVISEALVST